MSGTGIPSPLPPSQWQYGYVPNTTDWQAAFASSTGAAQAAQAQAAAAFALATAAGSMIATGSTTSRTLAARFAEIADVMDWITLAMIAANDHTAALAAAVATGLPVLAAHDPTVQQVVAMNIPADVITVREGYGNL